jgi:hypothetical protein
MCEHYQHCTTIHHPCRPPAGKHVLHAYLPASEPYEPWAGLDRRSEEYKRLKEERSQVGGAVQAAWLWHALSCTLSQPAALPVAD